MTDARALQKAVALAVPALLFGFLVTAQWVTFAGPASRDVAIRYIDPLSDSVTSLQSEQTGLKAQLADLRVKVDELQRAGAGQSGTVRDLQGRIEDLKASAGLAEATGEGVTVTLDAPRPAAAAPAGADRPTCFATDLTDIVNTAWRAGAVAVAIGAERIVASSSVYCVGATIVVNGSIVSAPFEVQVVGGPQRLLAAFDDPDQLRDLKRRRDQKAVVFQVSGATALTVPAYTGPVHVLSASPR